VRCRQLYPAIDLRLEVDNTENVAQAVLQGVADFGFIEGAIDDPALEKEVVGDDRKFLVVAPDHPWARGQRLGQGEQSLRY
jgi:DNA-binding transcriptional LysR family regulator